MNASTIYHEVVRPHATLSDEQEVAQPEELNERGYSPVRTSNRPFYTVLGWMNSLQYAAHAARLTQKPLKRNYRELSCGNKFTTNHPPKGGCTVCWTEFFHHHPHQVIVLKSGLEQGHESQLRAQFGDELVKQVKRVIAADTDEAVSVAA